MQARNCKERIAKLKQYRLDKGLTIEQCIELCGGFPSESTIRKLFSKGGGDKTYRESTIAALELAIIGQVYMPEISIPVEDVIQAQKDLAQAAAEELERKTRREALLIDQQKASLRTRDIIIMIMLVFDLIILAYDLSHQGIGFFNTSSSLVWFVQIAFVLCIAVTWTTYYVRSKKRRKEIEQLEIR